MYTRCTVMNSRPFRTGFVQVNPVIVEYTVRSQIFSNTLFVDDTIHYLFVTGWEACRLHTKIRVVLAITRLIEYCSLV